MKKFILLILVFVVFSSHDMFLKMDTYFISPNEGALIKLYNGTFEKSDNVINRDRMADVSLLGGGLRTAVDTSQWSEKDGVTLLNFTSGQPGTWVAGVSTKPRNISMSAADFNDYLEHDGVLDMLAWRKENNAMDQEAVEKYSKHVKAIFQVGDNTTDDFKTPLGYPLEFIPLENPYDLHPGHQLSVQLLWESKPLVDQPVYFGLGEHRHNDGDHSHSNTDDHEHEATDDEHHHHGSSARTDTSGVIRVDLEQQGIYYLRTIFMERTEEAGLTHESNWATLTFEVGEGHSHDHDEGHSHEGESGLNVYLFGFISLAIVMALFFWFNRKRQ